MVGVLHVPGCVRVASLQQRLHLIEECWLHDELVRSGMQCALVADHSGVVRVRQHRVERSGFDGRFDEGTVVNP